MQTLQPAISRLGMRMQASLISEVVKDAVRTELQIIPAPAMLQIGVHVVKTTATVSFLILWIVRNHALG